LTDPPKRVAGPMIILTVSLGKNTWPLRQQNGCFQSRKRQESACGFLSVISKIDCTHEFHRKSHRNTIKII
jgi:hypothetical protein